MLTREFNYMRKSQRVDIPLLVQVKNKIFKSSDWSMTGVAVLGYDGEIAVGDVIKARLVLPVVGASINIDVEMICRNKRGDKTGFEFHELSDRHKRVLRHYVELSLDGKLDNIEDLFSDFSAPDIESPIKEALNISEEEQVSLLRKFRSRAFLTLTAGFLLMGYIIFTFVYNYIFVYKAVGVVSGNLVQIIAGSTGTLKKNYMSVGSSVHVGDILFDVEEGSLLEELRKNKDQIEREQKYMEEMRRGEDKGETSVLLTLLEEEYLKKKKEYENAVTLYSGKVISIKDYQYVENSYSRARINYLREKETREQERRVSEEKTRLFTLKIDILQNEREQLLRRLENLRIRSPINGTVFTIDYFPGEYLATSDVVMTLATRENPFILFKMPSKQTGKAQLGMKVRVYSFEQEKTYEGIISSIGYSAINPRATLLQEVSLEQTVVKVDFPDTVVDIPLNSRVEVWVRKETPYLGRVLEYFNALRGTSDA